MWRLRMIYRLCCSPLGQKWLLTKINRPICRAIFSYCNNHENVCMDIRHPNIILGRRSQNIHTSQIPSMIFSLKTQMRQYIVEYSTVHRLAGLQTGWPDTHCLVMEFWLTFPPIKMNFSSSYRERRSLVNLESFVLDTNQLSLTKSLRKVWTLSKVFPFN